MLLELVSTTRTHAARRGDTSGAVGVRQFVVPTAAVVSAAQLTESEQRVLQAFKKSVIGAQRSASRPNHRVHAFVVLSHIMSLLQASPLANADSGVTPRISFARVTRSANGAENRLWLKVGLIVVWFGYILFKMHMKRCSIVLFGELVMSLVLLVLMER